MLVSVLIPTCERVEALVATLTALCAQRFRDFEVLISDQGEEAVESNYTVQSILRILRLHGHDTCLLRNRPRRGMAQQRQFLLDRARGRYALFLDNDVVLEADALERLVEALREEGCGFAGMALIGLSYRDDHRPHEQQVELWEGQVHPERLRPWEPAWQRFRLHNAANILHLGERLPGRHKYKVAWVGGCVLYDTAKLREAGGFEFWQDLPEEHCGEDVLAQVRLMERYGGFGLLPSGAYHLELPTTVENRRVNAPEFFLERQPLERDAPAREQAEHNSLERDTWNQVKASNL